MKEPDSNKTSAVMKIIRLNYAASIFICAFMTINLVLFSINFLDTLRYSFVAWWFLSVLLIAPSFIYTLFALITKDNKKAQIINLIILLLSIILMVCAVIFSETPDLGHIFN